VSGIYDGVIKVFFPAGFVLEVLEAFLGRTAAHHTGNTVVSYLRLNLVLGFELRGHLFEWLIAHDISCVCSEFDDIMPAMAKRHPACIAASPASDPQVYNRVVEGVDPGIWVVRDTLDSHQKRWVDVAYSIKLPNNSKFRAGFVMIECKTGYKKRTSDLSDLCRDFFAEAAQFARLHSSFYFMAIFACEFDFPKPTETTLPTNMHTAVVTISSTGPWACCPVISKFLAADPSSGGYGNALAEDLLPARASEEGAIASTMSHLAKESVSWACT